MRLPISARNLAAQPGRCSCGRALQRQGVGLHVLGDDAARADVGAVADLDRRHERRVGADEGALADVGEVLVEAVVVAEDGAGADVGALAHAAVADIGEVVGLGARLEPGVLDLDEVADVRACADVGARPEARERPDAGALARCARRRSGSWPGCGRRPPPPRRGRRTRWARWSRRGRSSCRS